MVLQQTVWSIGLSLDMSGSTKIEWTDITWNPVRGCSIVSAGCTNCYAMKQAHRFSGQGQAYEGLTRLTRGGPVWTGDVKLVPELLSRPLSWRSPKRIFVNSMSDLFHENVPLEFIAEVFNVMASATANCGKRHVHDLECWQGEPHTFQVLTKRPERMFKVISKELQQYADMHMPGDCPLSIALESWPLKNVWLGVSIEDQKTAEERIPYLLQTPAVVSWTSAEPLLGQVNLSAIKGVENFGWVVAGGESGFGARPTCLSWIQDIVRDCRNMDIPVFVKQLGTKPYINATSGDHEYLTLQDRKGGDISEFPSYLRARDFPANEHG